MKTKILIIVIWLAACNLSHAQANKQLSNLTSPTMVNTNLLPDKDSKRTLGNINKAWESLYLDNAIFIDSSRFIAFKTGAGSYNTAIGKDVLHSDLSGSSNTGVGYRCLYNNSGGTDNTAVGRSSLFNNTNGYGNLAVGGRVLVANTTGFYNTGLGLTALNSNTTGSSNTATGYRALYFSNGTENTATGSDALASNTSGSHNTAVGTNALYNNTVANYNTALGEDAGLNVTDGSNNTFIGDFANCGSGGHLTNSTALGASASVTTNNAVRIGNSSVTSIGGFANWTNISDGRVKKNIKQNVPGLAFINKLQPITYNLDLNAADKITQPPEIKDKNGKMLQPSQTELTARREKEQIVYTGFIAQDVEKAAKELNYEFSGVDAAKHDKDLYGLRYAEFVVPLVKAVQELSSQNDNKQNQIDSLEKNNQMLNEKLNALSDKMNQIENAMSLCCNNFSSSLNSSNNTSAINKNFDNASLEQNIPNPFTHNTTISYTLPQKFTTAQIRITDKNGKTLKLVNISGAGKGKLNVDASTLVSGAYNYSLLVDGKLIGTKQMILAR